MNPDDLSTSASSSTTIVPPTKPTEKRKPSSDDDKKDRAKKDSNAKRISDGKRSEDGNNKSPSEPKKRSEGEAKRLSMQKGPGAGEVTEKAKRVSGEYPTRLSEGKGGGQVGGRRISAPTGEVEGGPSDDKRPSEGKTPDEKFGNGEISLAQAVKLSTADPKVGHDKKHHEGGEYDEEDAQRKAAKVLLMLQGGIPTDQKGNLVDPDGNLLLRASLVDESLYEALPDPQEQTKSVPMLMHTNRKTPWEEEENPSEEYLEKKEAERLENIRKSRSPFFTWTFRILFHLCVLLNFVMACVDSFRMMMSESKLQALLLKGDFNCLEITSTSYLPNHLVHILQAMMSAMALYADNKQNASLCMSCVFAQAIHGSFKSLYFFMQMRFDEGEYFYHKVGYFVFEIFTDMVVSVVAIQRFYDLTDRIRIRSSNFAVVTEGMSMNDEIIYQNQSSFLQRKHILREAIASQVYTVIQKMDNYRKKGLEVDHLELFKELHAAKDALSDVNGVENRNLLKELKKATAQRFKQYGTDPNVLQDKHITVGQLSKIFIVNFGERDNPLLECKPSIKIANYSESDIHDKNNGSRHAIQKIEVHHHDENAKPMKPIIHHTHHDHAVEEHGVTDSKPPAVAEPDADTTKNEV